jgi:aspartate dehydrogenase
MERLRRPTMIFEGSPTAVVKAFPQNTNVAAALMLASGIMPSRMRVRVVADPTSRINVHEVEVRGDCGRIRCTIQSRPSTNPKTSELAIRSAIATLGRLFDRVVIGT